VKVKLLNRLPEWAGSGSTDNDLTPDGQTTFALRYLLGGIYDSYKRNADSEPTYLNFNSNSTNEKFDLADCRSRRDAPVPHLPRAGLRAGLL
jgi:hypothetical protein